MNEFARLSVYFGVVISLAAYGFGILLRRKLKFAILNPLLTAVVITITFLAVTGLDYDIYYDSAKYLSFLLTPATVCLAIPLYEQLVLLKKHWLAVFCGIFSGVLASLICITLLCVFFSLDYKEYATLLPKSVTTAIAIGITEELGGYTTITVAVIMITGILGNVLAEAVFRIFRITEPVAKGVALGTSSHSIGTAKALELGDIEGAMSSLSIAVAGLMTVVLAPVVSLFYPV